MGLKIRSGYSLPVKPEVALEVCNELFQQDNLTPQALVDVSRPVDAPLHEAFEWDDRKAANEYRKEQARHIIRCIVYENDSEESQPERVFVNIYSEDSGRKYEPLEVVLKNNEKTEYLLRCALRDMKYFCAKYAKLSQMASVVKTMRGSIENLERKGA